MHAVVGVRVPTEKLFFQGLPTRLLGNLCIPEISPPHCYFGDSMGPKGGALLMVEGKIKGRVTAKIEEIIGHLWLTLGISVDVMENALCNWQRHEINRMQAWISGIRRNLPVITFRKSLKIR